MYQETVFFHYILNNQIYLNTAKSEFFTSKPLIELFDIAKEHALKYKEAPSKEQLTELLNIKGIKEKYSDDVLEAIYNSKVQLQQYGEDWLSDNIGAWIQVRNLENVMRKSIAYMKTNKITTENASEVVEKVRHMMSSETALDFTFNLGSDFFNAENHLQERLARTSTGYSYLDKCLNGGWWKGSLIVFLAPPKGGKSMLMANLAALSVQDGHNTAYITLELQEELVNMRIGSNMLNIPMDEYETLAKDQDKLKGMLNKLKQGSLKPLGNLHVKEFSSSTMSTNDLKTYLIKAEEILGYKFENVFIDYINIMKNWRNPNTENLYMKIKQISEDLRAVAQEGNWAFITPTQTNKTGLDSSDLTISSVSESTALLHTVDGLFGLITNPEMKAAGEYYIKYLADRVSGMENTRKRFTFNRRYARIEEDMTAQIEDMDFIAATVGAYKKTASPKIHAAISEKMDQQEQNNFNNMSVPTNGLFDFETKK